MAIIDTWKRQICIVWAIAAKDIVDGLKNKTILGNIASLVFLIVFYKFLPGLEAAGNLPRLAVYDMDESRLVAQLENSDRFEFLDARSLDRLERFVGSADRLRLGLILPADLDRTIADGQPLVLKGYAPHWASQSDVLEAQAFVEAQLAELTGQTVRIDPLQIITHQIGWGGPGLLTALGTVLALTMMGTLTVTHLILEEKNTKTMEALNVSPASAWQIVAGKAVAGVVYCLVACAAVFALNVAVILNWVLLIAATLCGACFTVALGLLLGSIFETRQQMTLWGLLLMNILLLPVFLKIMTDIMPKALLVTFDFLPTVALSEAIQLSFANRAPIEQVAANIGTVLAGAVILLLGVVWKMQRVDR